MVERVEFTNGRGELPHKVPSHLAEKLPRSPAVRLGHLPEAEEARAEFQDIYDTYRDSGISAACQRFSSFSGIDMAARGEESAPQPPSAEMVAASERFFGHGLFPIALYESDFSALQAAPVRVIAAGGETSKGQFAPRAAAALAERLGTPLVEFPGGHGGFTTDARNCAAVLRDALV